MEEFFDNIVIYGMLLGWLIAAICIAVYYIKRKNGDISEKNSFLPFIGIASIFSTVGISLMIENSRYYKIEEKFYLGLALNIPMVIIFVNYIISYIKETKAAKIYAQEQKYSKW